MYTRVQKVPSYPISNAQGREGVTLRTTPEKSLIFYNCFEKILTVFIKSIFNIINNFFINIKNQNGTYSARVMWRHGCAKNVAKRSLQYRCSAEESGRKQITKKAI